jgi:hypothetical protein
MNIFQKQLLMRDRDGRLKPMAYYCGPGGHLLNDFTGPPLAPRPVSIEDFERDVRTPPWLAKKPTPDLTVSP